MPWVWSAVLVGSKNTASLWSTSGVDQLFAPVGRGVDHDPGGLPMRSDGPPRRGRRSTAAAVPGIVRIARNPKPRRRARDAGDEPQRGNGEKRQRHAALFRRRHLENSRKKFSLSADRDCVPAKPRAYSASNFCHLAHVRRLMRLPRNLPGAR